MSAPMALPAIERHESTVLMPLETFKASEPLTLGVELELQLVNTYDHDLSSSADDWLELLGRAPFPGMVTPEMTQSMIEVATGIHTQHGALLEQLRQIRDTLVRAGDRLNVHIAGGGTHPFQRWFEQRIFSKPRFEQLSGLYGYLAKQFTVFGQHVHVGCGSADEALFLLHALNRYVPHFIALSASSPYSQGVDTLFDSARLNSVFAFPLSGRAPFVLRWDDFAQGYFTKMESTGVVKSMKDFYWDIRPKPEYGTIELRVCDTPLTVERAAALAGYLQALCRYLLERNEPPPEEDDYLVYTYNRFQACRFGLDGTMVNPKTREQISIREDVLATLRKVLPHATALQAVPALDEVERAAARDGNHATYLRRCSAESGSIQGVVQAAVEAFRRPC
jgi:glutamate---cysteine ligase / carboxylate-amine ligase